MAATTSSPAISDVHEGIQLAIETAEAAAAAVDRLNVTIEALAKIAVRWDPPRRIGHVVGNTAEALRTAVLEDAFTFGDLIDELRDLHGLVDFVGTERGDAD